MDRRARFWLLFLGVSAALTLGSEFLPHEDELLAATHPTAPSAPRTASASRPATVAEPRLMIEFPRSRQLPVGDGLFRGKSFAVAPPPPPPPPP
ncbi:MAG: hypothetical protein KDH20_04385, partial [Rhodocyclaceae bacterium]|nr:hypothetical protein [Rhodocyclaceae bacterium]